MNIKKMRLGRLICSFILLFSMVCFSDCLLAQNEPIVSNQTANTNNVEEAKAKVEVKKEPNSIEHFPCLNLSKCFITYSFDKFLNCSNKVE